MNGLPLEIGTIVSFFQIPPGSGSRLIESVGRIHACVLLAMQQLPFSDDSMLQEDPLSVYWKIFPVPRNAGEEVSLELLSGFVRSTLDRDFHFQLDSGDHVIFSNKNRNQDLHPLCIQHNGRIYCFYRLVRNSLQFEDAAGNRFAVHPNNPFFEEIIDGFMEKKLYKLVLRATDQIPENKKSLENKKYTAHCYLACDYYKAKRYPEAIAEFEKAMKIKANMPQLFYNLALSYARVKSYPAAIQLLNQLNRLRPEQAKTFELLGDFYLQAGDADRAITHYERALELAENKTAIEAKLRKVEERVPRAKPEEARKEEEKEDRLYIQNCLQDLTLQAELGHSMPVIGREKELLQMQEILACQSKKNVIVIGDPGVGKTALVQELAYRIVAGKISARLHGKRIFRLNIGSLLAGAKFRGQFEERMINVVKEAKKRNCILFIDDIHQIMSSAGGKSGSMEASNFLKPALLNDDVQLIGATNLEDFRNTVEKDSSFLRCFQIIKVEEPEEETLMKILHAYRAALESFHNVSIHEESLETASMWVKVLMRDRALPDKALDLLDRSAARVSIQERTVVTSESILETISEISHVPLSRMSVSETAHYRNIETFLGRRVVGQPQAIGTVSKVLCTSKLRMTLNPNRPKGIFLFVGPTGVGKTELARSMAEFLFGDEEKIIRIDMSEYMERYSASRLIGTSPGYVGYYDQNQLVDKIRSNPYSLILLDEIEKADPQLLSLFLQVFDAGRLTDGKGKVAYFDNATIVMTSNIGTHLFAQNRLGYGAEQGEARARKSDLLKEVKRFFQPEFLNRIDEIVFFKPLHLSDVREIAAIKLATVFEQLRRQGKDLQIEEPAMTELCKIGYDYEYGARNLERCLRRHLLDKLAEMALTEEWPEIRTISAVWNQQEILLRGIGVDGYQEVVQSTVEQHDFLEE